ncbi:MAG: GNAT family N-acetyltransferase [Sedimentitalea sp.]
MIRTKRLLLRAAEPGDVDDLHTVFSDPETMRYWSTLPHSYEETRDFVEGMRGIDPKTGVDWVIEYQGRAVGKAGCWRLPEVGYILHRDFWGQHIMTEAMQALIPVIWRLYPDLPELIGDIDPGNLGSAKLLRKLGFVYTHTEQNTLQIGENWFDSDFYKLSRPS